MTKSAGVRPLTTEWRLHKRSSSTFTSTSARRLYFPLTTTSLTSLEEKLDDLKNVHVRAEEYEGKVVFLHQIKEGAADKSYGIHVAQLAELPDGLISRAKTILKELESGAKEAAPSTAPNMVKEAAEEAAATVADQPAQLSFFETDKPIEKETKALQKRAGCFSRI